jgi:hypothetical protein
VWLCVLKKTGASITIFRDLVELWKNIIFSCRRLYFLTCDLTYCILAHLVQIFGMLVTYVCFPCKDYYEIKSTGNNYNVMATSVQIPTDISYIGNSTKLMLEISEMYYSYVWMISSMG